MSEEEQNTAIKSTFIGFGEAAQAFADGWSSAGITGFKSYDIKTDTGGDLKSSKQRDFDEHFVIGCQSVEAAVEGASTIFSLVTADQAKRAAQMVSQYISKDAFYFDCNSCSPETKKTNSNVINSRGAKYIDVAIMAPVYPLLHRTPTLISGAYAHEAAKVLKGFGMTVSIVGDDIGQASAIKLSRSIVIKGMEALLGEFALTARSLGVEDIVLDSLEKSNPNYPWREQTAYALGRMVEHGERRSAEMNEAANMIAELSLPARMSRSAASWQSQIAELQIDNFSETLGERADQIIQKLHKK